MGDRYICPECSFLLCGEGGVNWYCDTPCGNCHNSTCKSYVIPQYPKMKE